jgi:hypothetical protein
VFQRDHAHAFHGAHPVVSLDLVPAQKSPGTP